MSAKPGNKTTMVQIRLTEGDRAKIEEVRERYGLPTVASTIRFSVETLHRMPVEKIRKKSGETA